MNIINLGSDYIFQKKVEGEPEKPAENPKNIRLT